jgi:CRP/FNR family transcriptional regulator
MKRQDIGSYLGLTVETVSRALSALDDAGLVRVDLREIEILDEAALLAPANRPLRAPAPPAVKPAPARTRIARRNTTWADMLGAAAA